jgi:hypothetical protein
MRANICVLLGLTTMYCPTCGTESPSPSAFCANCGAPSSSQTPPGNSPAAVSGGTLGYSPRINDPAFARYVKNTNRYAGIFAGILAVAAFIGFTVYGETSSEMDNPQAMYIGMGIGGMFLFIALLTTLSRKRSKTWDGVVADKTIKNKRRKQSTGQDRNDFYWVNYVEYKVIIREDRGKNHELTAEDDDTRYNYFQLGDRVRHHGKLNSYEKYDKTRDTVSFCNACASLNDIRDEVCFRCKCPLLK